MGAGTVLHLISETAAHSGHLDAARELIDGKQHLVLTETTRTGAPSDGTTPTRKPGKVGIRLP